MYWYIVMTRAIDHFFSYKDLFEKIYRTVLYLDS